MEETKVEGEETTVPAVTEETPVETTEEKVEEVMSAEITPHTCVACSGTGLKDQNNLCPECAGHGVVSVAV